MSKQLDPADFRAGRWKLDPDDFALGSDKPDPPPRDLIDQETWQSIILLPDDVSIRTSDSFGRAVNATHKLCADWVHFTLEFFGPHEDERTPLNTAVTNSFSELYASLYNAVVGYYRTGISAMRNALEHLVIGLDFQLSGDTATFNDWMNGNEDETIKFGKSATRLTNEPGIKAFETRIRVATGDNMFHQKDRSAGDAGGFSRRLFSELSMYTHGAPGRTEADLRASAHSG